MSVNWSTQNNLCKIKENIPSFLLIVCKLSRKWQRVPHHNFLIIIFGLLHLGTVFGSHVLLFVDSQTCFLAKFCLSTQPLSGCAFSVHGQCWNMLIESGPVPNLAPRHISTEPRTNSQTQILATGRFVAEGISLLSQRHTNTGRNMTPRRGGQTYRCFCNRDTHYCKNT